MKRPDFVSDKDIIRWSDVINKDTPLPEGFGKEPVFREILYSGLWLAEELMKLGCEAHKIVQIQYTHGYQSFGNDSWALAQLFLEDYKNDKLKFEDDGSLPEKTDFNSN